MARGEHLLKIGVSGIRGVVGDFLTPALGCAFAQAFGTYVGATRARGGLALTASHNPPEYHALKLFNSEGLFFNQYERSELVDLYHQSDFRQATNEEIRGVRCDFESPTRLHI